MIISDKLTLLDHGPFDGPLWISKTVGLLAFIHYILRIDLYYIYITALTDPHIPLLFTPDITPCDLLLCAITYLLYPLPFYIVLY